MIGRTLFWYLFRQFSAVVLQLLIGIVVIAYLVDFTEMARRASNWPNYSFQAGLLLSLLKLPTIIETALPFVILFASMLTLIALSRKSELVVTRAAGVSAWQFLGPLCLAALVAGLLSLFILNPISAWSFGVVQGIEANFRGDNGGADDRKRVPWMQQRDPNGVTIIGAARTAEHGLLLSQAVFLRFSDDSRLIERIDADQARLVEGGWELTNAVRLNAAREREQLASMRIESRLEPAFVEERLARPEAISFFELGRKIEVARALGLQANAFAMQFQSLMAMPLLMVAMTLIAATVSMRFVRMGQSGTLILGGVLAGFLLYVVTVLVKAFGSSGVISPVIAAWLPVTVAMFSGVTFLLYKEDG
jgi:lipopolysaccharide export system permease protein